MLQHTDSGPFVSYWQFAVTNLADWREQTREVVEHLRTMPGFTSAQTLRYVDEPEIVSLLIQWETVGQYRKALSAGSSKLLVWPFLMSANEVPGAFETLDIWTGEQNQSFASAVGND
jgi:hypothetical protein